jgi:hypothetical protein
VNLPLITPLTLHMLSANLNLVGALRVHDLESCTCAPATDHALAPAYTTDHALAPAHTTVHAITPAHTTDHALAPASAVHELEERLASYAAIETEIKEHRARQQVSAALQVRSIGVSAVVVAESVGVHQEHTVAL